jgi:hypothetical protein
MDWLPFSQFGRRGWGMRAKLGIKAIRQQCQATLAHPTEERYAYSAGLPTVPRPHYELQPC